MLRQVLDRAWQGYERALKVRVYCLLLRFLLCANLSLVLMGGICRVQTRMGTQPGASLASLKALVSPGTDLPPAHKLQWNVTHCSCSRLPQRGQMTHTLPRLPRTTIRSLSKAHRTEKPCLWCNVLSSVWLLVVVGKL